MHRNLYDRSMQTRPRRAATAVARTSLAAFLAFAAVAGPVAAAGIPGPAASPARPSGGPAAMRDLRSSSASSPAEAPWRSAAREAMLTAIQGERAAGGLVAYLRDPALDEIAQARVDRLAANDAFGHTAAGPSILDPVEASGMRPYAAGEAQGWASDPSVDAALARIRMLWLASPGHRAIVLADWASYAGIGLATEGARTLVVLVIADTPDRTAPSVAIDAVTRTGSTVTVRWTAADPLLQARTAGVGGVAVEWRTDHGRWRVARPGTAATTGAGQTIIVNVPTGRAVEIRVQARDRAGNVSPWSTDRVAALP